MNPLDWVKAALGKGIVEPLADYFKRKQELKQARFEAQLKAEQAAGDRRAQLIRDGLAADANWEMEFARQAASSWKDEYTLIVVSIPAILAFVKVGGFDGAALVAAGFAALGLTPMWYQILLGTMFGATVGVRWWRRSQSDT
jgi:hypothetical protein